MVGLHSGAMMVHLKQTGGVSVSPHLTACGFFGEAFLPRGMFYDYWISFLNLIITIENSEVALWVQMRLTFRTALTRQVSKETSTKLFSLILSAASFLDSIESWQRKREVRTAFQNLKNASKCSEFRQLLNNHLEILLGSRQLV